MNGIDFDTFVHRLLLFDCYVLKTIRFKEIPYFIKVLEYDQTLELLRSGLIRFRCEAIQVASQRDAEFKQLKKPTFSLIWIDAHDWEKYVANCLADIRSELALPDAKWEAIESAIRACVQPLDPAIRTEFGLSFVNTIDSSEHVLKESVRLAGKKRRVPIVLPDFEVSVDRRGDLTYVESDLSRTRIPTDELWEILRDGLMGVATLEQNIGEMKNYQALGGFSLDELPVFQARLSGLAHIAFPGHTERRATRIAKITGLPGFDPEKTTLNVSALLRVRESDELRAFRDWLATSDGLPDKRVRELLRGYRARVASFARAGSVTMSRLMFETLIGLTHPVAGLGLSVLDWFLIEKLFPYSGPAAFVNRTFPSLFTKRK